MNLQQVLEQMLRKFVRIRVDMYEFQLYFDDTIQLLLSNLYKFMNTIRKYGSVNVQLLILVYLTMQ